MSDGSTSSDRLARERLDENLHATAQTKHEMEGRLLLDVIVRQCAAVLQLLPSEDKTLLVGWDAFLILDLLFNVLDRVGGLNL